METATIPTPPLALRLDAPRPAVVVGESVVLQVTHTVYDPLTLETVELNRARTCVRLSVGRGWNAEVRALTGADHTRLYRVPALAAVGRSFEATPEDHWTSELDLFQYTLPLAAGAWRAVVEYRYGDAEEEVTRSNPVDFDVRPLAVERVSTRWFGGDGPRDEPASVAVAAAPDGRWLFRVAARHDVGLVVTGADLGPVAAAHDAPALAHLNDIAPMHFHRVITWVEDGAFGWLLVQPRGRVAGPYRFAHGLAPAPPPVCADPALQRRDGGLTALLAGHDARGAPQLSLVTATADGAAQATVYPRGPTTPANAAVLWGADEARPTGAAFYVEGDGALEHLVRLDLQSGAAETWRSTPERTLALRVDQWLGRGHLFALTREGSVLRTHVWNLDDEPPAASLRGVVDLDGLPAPLEGPFSATPLPEGRGLALLFRAPDAWVVISPDGRRDVPFASLPPHTFAQVIVNQRGRAWLAVESPLLGPLCVRLDGRSDG